MAKRTKIELSESEAKALQRLVRSTKAEQRMVKRAKIILLWSNGSTFAETEEELGLSQTIINKWRKRFAAQRLDGLRDAPRSGAPPRHSATKKAAVIQLATQNPSGGYTVWSQRRIAREVGMSQSTVQQILKHASLKPHKIEYWCGKSPDPEFQQKMTEIIGLYLNPPENAFVLSVDEKTQIQALDRTQPVLPMQKNRSKRLTSTYLRNGTVALQAALAVHHGEITAQTVERNTSVNFLSFLQQLSEKYPEKHLHVILDNLAVHKHQMVRQWAASTQRVTLHFTPTYASWLNQIEMWFNILTKDVLRGGVWQSKQELVEQLMAYVKTYNAYRAKPFHWTYTGHPLTV